MAFLDDGTIVDYTSAPIQVSTVTQLWPPAGSFGAVNQPSLQLLEVVLENQDNANNAVLTVDVSEGGLPNLDEQRQAIVKPASEGFVRYVGRITSLLRVSASGDPSAAFPQVNVRFKIRGKRDLLR